MLCGVAPIFFTALPLSCLQRLRRVVLLPSDESTVMYSGCCVAFPPSLPLTALVEWLYPIPFTALAVWLGSYAVYITCCVALPLSCLQPLLYGLPPMTLWPLCCLQRFLCGVGGLVPILFTALAVVSACSLAWLLSCLARMLFTVLAVRLESCSVYSACCVAWSFCCLQRLLCAC